MKHFWTILFGAMGIIWLFAVLYLDGTKDINSQITCATASIICFIFCVGDVLKNKIEDL